LGLVEGLKRVDPITIQKRIVTESKSVMLEQIKKACCDKKDELERIVQEMSDEIVAKIARMNQLKEQYLQQMSDQLPNDLIKDLRKELKFLKKSLRQDWRKWVLLSKDIMRLASNQQGMSPA